MPLPPNPRIGQLKGQFAETYGDSYEDDYGEGNDFVGLFASKTWIYVRDLTDISGFFAFEADTQEEDDSIWAAVLTVWNNRDLYTTLAALRADINDALEVAGYTAPDGGPIL